MTDAGDRWRQVEELFFAALELEPDKREAYLHRAADPDGTLRADVRELLDAHEGDGGFDRMAGRFGRGVAASTSERATKTLVDRLNAALTGRYRIERELGRGGMATVYLADDLRHDRKVALKLLGPELAAAIGHERFLAEITTTARLQHPQILPLFDSGRAGDSVFYVMPYVEGESVRQRLDREGTLPVEEAVRIATTVAEALDYAHRKGVVHRDIKPANILLHEGQAVVADFGVAVLLRGSEGEADTRGPTYTGTPLYMSPEQAGGASVDARSDVYALGCVLYEMLVGTPPISAPSLTALLERLPSEEPRGPSQLRTEVGEALDAAVMRALAKGPDDRYPSGAEFARVLEELTVAQRGVRGRESARRGFFVVGAAAAAVALVAAAVLVRPAEPPAVSGGRQITFNGQVQEAALSPVGDHFAFTTLESGTYRLFLQEGDESPVALDSVPDFLCCPTWSPDGERIAYRRGPRSTGATVVAGRDGVAVREVSTEPILAWSPAGSRLLSWWPQATVLLLTDVETGAVVDSVPLGRDHVWVRGAGWAPGGDRIVVVLTDDLEDRIRVLALDGTVLDQLVADSGRLASPSWSPNGRDIRYVAGDDLWAFRVSPNGRRTGEPRRVLAGVGWGISNTAIPITSTSRDGRRLLYPRFTAHANLWRFSRVGEGTGPPSAEQLTRGTAIHTRPRLSPDGHQIAVVERREGRSASLDVMPAEGGPQRRLVFFEQGVRSLAWSPDGTTIAVRGDDGGGPGLWLVDAETAVATPADLGVFDADELVWAPGREIIYQRQGHTEIRAVDPERWTERVVRGAEEGIWWYDLRLGPTGEELYARREGEASGEGVLWVLDVATGAGRPVHDEVQAAVGSTRDGRWVMGVILTGRTAITPEILRFPAGGGDAMPYVVLGAGQGVNSLDVTFSADARVLVAAVPVYTTDVWMVEDFDPGRGR